MALAFRTSAAALIDNTYEVGPYLAVFLLGSLAAFVHRQFSSALRPATIACAFEVFAWLAAGVVLLHVPSVWGSLSGRQIPVTYFHPYPTRFGVLWALCVLALLNGMGYLERALAARPLRFVGVISFSIYLWHMLVLNLVVGYQAFSAPLRGWIVIVLTLALASVSYLLVERPSLQLGLFWSRRPFVAGGDPRPRR